METWVEDGKRGVMVSSCGRIRNIKTGHVYKGSLNNRGYLKFTGPGQKLYMFHQVVCEAFHGHRPSGKTEIAHYNGDKLDNRAENLRWASVKENRDDRRRLGEGIGRPKGVIEKRKRIYLGEGPGPRKRAVTEADKQASERLF